MHLFNGCINEFMTKNVLKKRGRETWPSLLCIKRDFGPPYAMIRYTSYDSTRLRQTDAFISLFRISFTV